MESSASRLHSPWDDAVRAVQVISLLCTEPILHRRVCLNGRDREAFLYRPGDVLSHQSRPQIGRDHPLNLSISLSGGKETNQDSLSSGE